MQHLYIVTMWSGGRANKKWKTDEEPLLLPQGTGVRFRDLDTRLTVQVIGSVSVEEYEQGSYSLTEEVDLPEPEATPDQ